MNRITDNFLNIEFGLDEKLIETANNAELELKADFETVDEIAMFNQTKVLKAFMDVGISDSHFGWNTGYGYDDAGRDAVERVFARAFDAEKALVRPNIVNGTHAISLALLGLLKRGDKLIYVTGSPYDTLQSVIGYKGFNNNTESDNNYLHSNNYDKTEFSNSDFTGTLKDLGVDYEEVDLLSDGSFNIPEIINVINKDFYDYHDNMGDSKTEKRIMIAIQRSKGYSFRNSIIVNQIQLLISEIRKLRISRHIIFMVDNCYCEFTELSNPILAGADIICGSLIKNPGGGLALSGGYLCGRSDLIDQASFRLTCPGIGAECGLTFGQNRAILQGLFQASRVTADAVKGAMLCGKVFEKYGFEISPSFDKSHNKIEFLNNNNNCDNNDNNSMYSNNSLRCDIIQAVKLGSKEAVQAFCSGIQAAAPVDSHVTPVPAPMPGYDDEIIMAAGTFVQGASIELSADGPLREPYTVYFQGGLTYEHSKIGVLMAAQKLADAGLITL